MIPLRDILLALLVTLFLLFLVSAPARAGITDAPGCESLIEEGTDFLGIQVLPLSPRVSHLLGYPRAVRSLVISVTPLTVPPCEACGPISDVSVLLLRKNGKPYCHSIARAYMAPAPDCGMVPYAIYKDTCGFFEELGE